MQVRASERHPKVLQYHQLLSHRPGLEAKYAMQTEVVSSLEAELSQLTASAENFRAREVSLLRQQLEQCDTALAKLEGSQPRFFGKEAHASKVEDRRAERERLGHRLQTLGQEGRARREALPALIAAARDRAAAGLAELTDASSRAEALEQELGPVFADSYEALMRPLIVGLFAANREGDRVQYRMNSTACTELLAVLPKLKVPEQDIVKCKISYNYMQAFIMADWYPADRESLVAELVELAKPHQERETGDALFELACAWAQYVEFGGPILSMKEEGMSGDTVRWMFKNQLDPIDRKLMHVLEHSTHEWEKTTASIQLKMLAELRR